jgi:NADP-dependent 3-hydroxy acid dehydrogenase YdfG
MVTTCKSIVKELALQIIKVKSKKMKRSGNTVLITGGSAGIGLAIAEVFLKEGNEVIICGRTKWKLAIAFQN